MHYCSLIKSNESYSEMGMGFLGFKGLFIQGGHWSLMNGKIDIEVF